jgi:hypothetical protein
MRRVDRGSEPPPPALTTKDRSGLTELERARAHQQSLEPDKGSFAFAVYRAQEVKQRLEELFHGKCAYCETFYASSAPVDVEHFRPKGAVDGEPDHPGYWWLAMSWSNLLPSCIDCNRKRTQPTPDQSASLFALVNGARRPNHVRSVLTGKKDSFPVAGTRALPEASDFTAEQALLLDPCADDPEDHIDFNVGGDRPIPLALPRAVPQEAAPAALSATAGPIAAAAHDAAALAGLSVRGAVSIQVYGLNRLRLVQDRLRILRQLEYLGYFVKELGALIDDLSGAVEGNPPLSDAVKEDRANAIIGRLRLLLDRALIEMRSAAAPEAPYSAMAAKWLKEFSATI